MHYPGPDRVDFDDVHALNQAFLALLRQEQRVARLVVGLRDDLSARFAALSERQAERLARAPFLLMSFRENDERFWDEVHAAEPRYDLFAESPPTDSARLVAAGLGFAWQLARQNPYALRLVCGASLHWCERLSERPLVHILDCAAARDDILILRADADANLWSKLLFAGVSNVARLRAAAHLSSLQMLLTRTSDEPRVRWASAACRTRVPNLSIARDGDRHDE